MFIPRRLWSIKVYFSWRLSVDELMLSHRAAIKSSKLCCQTDEKTRLSMLSVRRNMQLTVDIRYRESQNVLLPTGIKMA